MAEQYRKYGECKVIYVGLIANVDNILHLIIGSFNLVIMEASTRIILDFLIGHPYVLEYMNNEKAVLIRILSRIYATNAHFGSAIKNAMTDCNCAWHTNQILLNIQTYKSWPRLKILT